MSKYIDYDKLDNNILALNEKGWEITRGEYKRIQSVMFEMIELEIPDNATNGDMIRVLFPHLKYTELRSDEWWNAPYKKGESE